MKCAQYEKINVLDGESLQSVKLTDNYNLSTVCVYIYIYIYSFIHSGVCVYVTC